MFSPRLISETRLGFTRQRTFFPNALQSTNAADVAGIANVNNPAVAYSGGLPILSVGGFTSLGESNIQPFITIANNYQVIENFVWMQGNHSFKFGASLIRRQYNFYQALNQRGNFTFDGSFSSQLGVGNTGSGLADFLLGLPLNSTLAVINNPVGQRQVELGAYAQDTWKITRKVTLTLGIRYELFSPRTEVYDRQANFDPTFLGGSVVVASDDAPCGRALRCTDYGNAVRAVWRWHFKLTGELLSGRDTASTLTTTPFMLSVESPPG